MRCKRAQGALEFLMTYGWAFLVILIMIGALAYFGVLNPSKFLPERCTFGAEVLCQKGEFRLTNDANQVLLLKLTNQIGSSVTVQNAVLTGEIDPECDLMEVGTDSELLDSVDIIAGGPGSLPWPEGKPLYFKASNCGNAAALTTGDKIKVEFSFEWYAQDPAFTHKMTGEIYATVQEGPVI